MGAPLSGYLWDSDDEKTAKKVFGEAWTPIRSEVVWKANAKDVAQGRSKVDIVAQTDWAMGSARVGLAYWPNGPVIGTQTVDAGRAVVFTGVPIRDGTLALVMPTTPLLGLSISQSIRVVDPGTGQGLVEEGERLPPWVPVAVTGGVITIGLVALAYMTGQLAPLLKVFKR